MTIRIIIDPEFGDKTTFGDYGSLGEALHVAASLKQHMNFSGTVFVEEHPSMLDCTLQGVPDTIRRYEIPVGS